MAVGVSPHLTRGVDMLLGQDVTQFRSLLKAALADESIAETVRLETTDPEKTKSDVAMVTTRATKRKEEEEHCETESTQEREESLTHGLEEQELEQFFILMMMYLLCLHRINPKRDQQNNRPPGTDFTTPTLLSLAGRPNIGELEKSG